MQQTESPLTPSGTSIETIESIVKTVFESLRASDLKNDFGELVYQRLKNEAALSEFRKWLRDDIKVKSLAKLKKSEGNVAPSVLRDAAWDALQVVVLAYLPGSRYFQGAYIYSQLHDPGHLKSIKSTFRVPHLSGTVGWMTAHLLSERVTDRYVVLADAQLDLRGRVAVPDLHLGNRSVLGFPVSLNENNKELASISGFVFFSHPVPGVFPNPSTPLTDLGASFAAIRTQHESALASAVESYIFRRSGKSILTQHQALRSHPRTPLLTLSDADPSGYLVSILFEADQNRNLVAEVEINEGVLLETASSLLRVVSIYPDKWAPRFVQNMRHLGNLIEGDKKLYARLPMYWFSRGQAALVTRHYPERYKNDVKAYTPDLLEAAVVPPPPVAASMRPHGIEGALADVMALFGARTGADRQADLIVPIVCDQGGTTHAMGFFRVNCDATNIREDGKIKDVFQNLWHIMKEIQDKLNPEAAQLFLALDNTLSNTLDQSCRKSPNHAEIRHFKLCTDTVNILSDWLVRQVHLLIQKRISQDGASVAESELTQQQEFLREQKELIRFGLDVLSCSKESPEAQPGASLTQKFNDCSDKLENLLRQPTGTSGELMPEITFVSFWPRMKLPTIKGIDYFGDESAEEAFSELLLSDPGLLRMLSVVAPMLQADDPLNLGADRQLNELSNYWRDVHFGVPTNSEITGFKVTRPSDIKGLVLDIEWTKDQSHRVRLIWNWGDPLNRSRELGGHSISNVPWVVARRLGENILTDLKMTMAGNIKNWFKETGFTDGKVLDYVSSSDIDDLKQQFGYLERAMLYDDFDAAIWRLLKVPTKSHSFVFLAALYNQRIKRPSVLAFRDFALANASSFYVAREYDAQLQAADQYTQNLRAIAHGYKGPIKQLILSVNQAHNLFPGTGEYPATQISKAFGKLHNMAVKVSDRANDAILYAVRAGKDLKPERRSWIEIEDEIKGVIQAFDFPWSPIVHLAKTDVRSRIVFESVWAYWRHLLSNTIDNAIGHGEDNPDQANGPKVFIEPEVGSSRFLLKIANFVPAEKLMNQAKVVHSGMIDGIPTLTSNSNNKSEVHGYGLLEVHRCCKLLHITPEVEVDSNASKLIVSFDGSTMIRGSK